MKASEFLPEVGIRSGLRKIAGGNVLAGAAQTLGGLSSAALAPLHWMGGGKIGTAPALTSRQKAEQEAIKKNKEVKKLERDTILLYKERINNFLSDQGINPYKSVTQRDPNYDNISQAIKNFILNSDIVKGDGRFDKKTEQFIAARLVSELSNIPMPTTINEPAITGYLRDLYTERARIIQQGSNSQTARSTVQSTTPIDLSGAQVIRASQADPNTYVRYNNFVYTLPPGANGQWVSQRGRPINQQYNDAFNQLISNSNP